MQIWSFFGSHFPVFSPNTNHEIIPNFDTSHLMTRLSKVSLMVPLSKVSLMLDRLITKLYTALEKFPKSKSTHEQIRCCSLKICSADISEKSLGRLDFPNHHNFENINNAYSNFIQKFMGVIDLLAPIKSRRIKQNSQKWFDSEVVEKKVSVTNYLRNLKNQNFTLTKKYVK